MVFILKRTYKNGAAKVQITVAKTLVSCIRGDLTVQRVDAIVNAANPKLAGGGGVDGAIHRAGGPAIMAECRELIARIDTLQVGQAVATTAGRLAAKHVVHTVGPVWRGGGHGERENLASAYRESLKCCETLRLKTVALPAISAGVYGYPLAQAAEVAVESICLYARTSQSFDELRFVLFSEETLHAFKIALTKQR
jgi:O-acetyl-ADP-ribose deacetylase (regulator of RNase III)